MNRCLSMCCSPSSPLSPSPAVFHHAVVNAAAIYYATKFRVSDYE